MAGWPVVLAENLTLLAACSYCYSSKEGDSVMLKLIWVNWPGERDNRLFMYIS